jgi:hypothetical protein
LFGKLLAIAINTFLETIRQPIFGVVLATTLLMMMLNVSLAAYTLDDDDKLLTELGLSTLLLSGLFLASFSATSVLTREVEVKTVLTVISKPVSRWVFILGKYLGLVGGLAVAYYISTLAFVFCLQHKVLQSSADTWHQPVLALGLGGAIFSAIVAGIRNYVTGKEFITTALTVGTPLLTVRAVFTFFLGRQWEWQGFELGLVTPPVLLAIFLVFCTVMVLAAIALAASTRVGQVMTLTICLGTLVVGLITDYLLSSLAQVSMWANILYRHIPNFSVFWIIEAVNNEQGIPVLYAGYVTVYAAMMSLAALAVGIALFQRREVG